MKTSNPLSQGTLWRLHFLDSLRNMTRIQITFTTGDSSEKLKGWKLPMNGSNMKPMNFVL